MEIENKYASRGMAGSALGLAIGGLGLSLLNGGLGNILGTNRTNNTSTETNNGATVYHCGCSEDHFVNRYELGLQQLIASKDSRIGLLESNIYTDSKISDVYERLNNKIGAIEGQIGQQAVYNATNTATLGCISGQIAQLMGLTKTIIPADNVCPAPMPQYNSWTAPTATT